MSDPNHNRKRVVLLLRILLLCLLLLLITCTNPVENFVGIIPVYPEIDDNPIFHPDGQRIVYQHNGITEVGEGGSTEGNVEDMGLWIADTDGGNAAMLIQGRSIRADFSPDGNWIVYEQNALIYKAPFAGSSIDTSQIFRLTPGGRNFFPDWSPDGEWIVHHRSLTDSHGPSGVWLVKPDGTDWHYVFGAGNPSWHPDSKSIIGRIRTGPTSPWYRFIRFYLDGEAAPDTLDAVIGRNNRRPRFSPDGERIVFQSIPEEGNNSIWVMDTDGSNLKHLIDGYEPSWSPDGSQIIFIRKAPFVRWGLGTIWIMDRDGSNLRQITFVPGK